MRIVVLVKELRNKGACPAVALEVRVSTEVSMDMRYLCMDMCISSSPAGHVII
jgi:hypothetical protein